MRNKWIPVMVVTVVVVLGGLWTMNNALISKEEGVDAAWAQVQTTLQRRADLIPNLVATVQGYATHEREVFTSVADARARLAGATTPAEVATADAALSSTLSRLLVIAERYPDLKANQNFQGLQDELAGTENRIAVARMRYNDRVRQYNVAIRRFPGVLVAAPLGYTAKDYFAVAPSAQTPPAVDFSR